MKYALVFKPDINKQDVEGLTPLHLAVRNVDKSFSCRSVRSLLFKGAKINIRDKNGKIPSDYIIEAPEELQNELRQLLIIRKGGNALFGGRPVVQQTKNPAYNLVFYYLVFVFTFILKFIQLLTRMQPIVMVMSLVIDLMTLVLHIVLSSMNPGHIKNEGIDFLNLLEAFEA